MHLLEIFLRSGVIIKIDPALCVRIILVLILLCDMGAKCRINTTCPYQNKGSWNVRTRCPPARAGSETWSLTASWGGVGNYSLPLLF